MAMAYKNVATIFTKQRVTIEKTAFTEQQTAAVFWLSGSVNLKLDSCFRLDSLLTNYKKNLPFSKIQRIAQGFINRRKKMRTLGLNIAILTFFIVEHFQDV